MSLLSKNRKKVTDTIRLPYHLFFCVVLIYCLPLLCDYIHEEAPPIRIQGQITALQEYATEKEGIDVDIESVRYYPGGEVAAHVLGYTGEMNDVELAKRRADGYRLGDVTGKMGLEVTLELTSYTEQIVRLPKIGRHIIAQFDDEGVVVYQAYRPAIGEFAATHGYFGGEFSFSRMSWIKPNFLWMMYRSGWGQKKGQEVVLAVKIKREAFDTILAAAVCSGYESDLYPTEEDWKHAVNRSDVRLQWDPDHSPTGGKLARKAIQLGLRGDALAAYAREWIISIEDISEFVCEQRHNLGDFNKLVVPSETIYPVVHPDTISRLQLSTLEISTQVKSYSIY